MLYKLYTAMYLKFVLAMLAMGIALVVLRYYNPDIFKGTWYWYLAISTMVAVVYMCLYIVACCCNANRALQSAFNGCFALLKLELFAMASIMLYADETFTVPLAHVSLTRGFAISAISFVLLFEVVEELVFNTNKGNMLRLLPDTDALNGYLRSKHLGQRVGSTLVSTLAADQPAHPREHLAAQHLIRHLQLKYPEEPRPYR